MDVQVPVKSGKTVHVNKNYAIELKSQNFAIKVKNTKITESSFQWKKVKTARVYMIDVKKQDTRRKPPDFKAL